MNEYSHPSKIIHLFFAAILLTACQPSTSIPTPQPTASPVQVLPTPTKLQPTPITFPAGINPLTGRPVADLSLLKIPALLISISHFPATGRPQAGLSFASFVYEIYITEGATRFLAVLYGEVPQPELHMSYLIGQCGARAGVFHQTGLILGNQVWFDENANGTKDIGERGVAGVCVNLYDPNGQFLQQTSTDTNGYYGFNLQPGQYFVEFIRPDWAQFTYQNIRGTPGSTATGVKEPEDPQDSDADQSSGWVEVEVTADILSLDAGLVALSEAAINQDPAFLPAPQVGPVRSGRLIHGYIANYYPHSCLIFAGASNEVLARLPTCYLVYHQLAGGGYMLDINEMHAVAEKNRRDKGSDFDYASNIFSDIPPSGGLPALELSVYYSYLNQSGWFYDPLYQAYLRYVDTSEMETAGLLGADVDRLTGRQMYVENIIVLFAQHDVVSPTNLDIRLNPGRSGKALLFRDGRVYQIKWSTDELGENDQKPISFLDLEGVLVPLKPGHTWVLVVTRDSSVQEKTSGRWQLLFTPPEGAQ